MSLNTDQLSLVVEKIESFISTSDILTLEQKKDFEAKVEQFNKLKNATSLKVMLFGAYNAGKSTFINTVLAKEVAQVDDVPTTDEVHEYAWNGIIFCDTPGINAPIEHQQVTEEYLKNIHAVVFIIRETDVDAINLYERMFEMLSVGKNIFIIFNHQFKKDDNEKRDQVVTRIQENLVNIGSGYRISNEAIASINIFPIRLRSACKGIIEGKTTILNNSGFNEFKEAFQYWLDFNTSHQEYLKSLELYLSEHIFSALEQHISDKQDGASEYNALLDEKRYIEQEKISLSLDTKHKIDSLVQSSKPKVIAVLDHSQTQEIAEAEINQIFLSLQDKMVDMLKNELEHNNLNALKKWQKKLDGFPNSNGQDNQLIKGLLKNGMELLSKEENLKQILLQGRKLKIPGLKGRWEKTLGKWAGKGAIAVQVLIAGYELYDAHTEQSKNNQQAKEIEIVRYQLIQMILDSFNQNLSDYAETIISDVYNKKLDMLRDSIESIQLKSKETDKFMSQISLLKRQIDELYSNDREKLIAADLLI